MFGIFWYKPSKSCAYNLYFRKLKFNSLSAYIKYVQLFVCQLYLNKMVLKKKNQVHSFHNA